MAESEWVERELDNHDFAQVLVRLKAPAPGATISARLDAGSTVYRHFLDRVPDEAGGAAAAFSKTETRRAIPTARQFPRLGVALGYVDRPGKRRLDADATVEAVHPAHALSLIRPQAIRSARATSQMTWGLLRLSVKRLWDQGLTGKNVKVCHLDTGVDATHPALRRRIAKYLETDLQGHRVAGATPRESDSFSGHGTHTAGIICGGKVGSLSIGVAPGACLYSGMVIEGGKTLLRVLEGMEWALEQNVKVLSMSLGFPGYSDFFVHVTQRLRDEGVLPVIAIGNEGPDSSRSPGNYPQTLSVGACNRSNHVTQISSSKTFPNRNDEPNQPNVVAPGDNVRSAKPGGGVSSLDGTSVATPHVAGVAAILFEAKPRASVADVERAIQDTCVPLPPDPPLRYGHGLIDPPAALKALTSP